MCWLFDHYKHSLVKVIGFLNVALGISVSTYCVNALALTESVVFFAFIPFILFRAATPDSLKQIWQKIRSAYLNESIHEEEKEEFDHVNADQPLKELPKKMAREMGDTVKKKDSYSDLNEVHEMRATEKSENLRRMKGSVSSKPYETIWRTIFLCFAPLFLHSVLTLKIVFRDVRVFYNPGDHSPSKLEGFLYPVDQRFAPTVTIMRISIPLLRWFLSAEVKSVLHSNDSKSFIMKAS